MFVYLPARPPGISVKRRRVEIRSDHPRDWALRPPLVRHIFVIIIIVAGAIIRLGTRIPALSFFKKNSGGADADTCVAMGH